MNRRTGFFWRLSPEFFFAVLLTAFGIGVLGVNLLWEPYLQSENILGIYLLFQLSKEGVPGRGYFLYILKFRGSWLIVCALGSFSVWGVFLAVLTVAATGFVMGAVLTLSILQFGVLGIACGAALFLPQALCYLPSVIFLMGILAQRSYGNWKKAGRSGQKKKDSYRITAVCLFLYFMGMLLESYLNPMLLAFVMERLKIF